MVYRPDDADAVVSRPAAPATIGTQKWYRNGLQGSYDGTELNAEVMNMLLAEQENVRALNPGGDPGGDPQDDSQMADAVAALVAQTAAQTVPYSVVEGFHCRMGAADPTHDVTIGPGLCRDATNVYQIDFGVGAGWTKRLDALWGAGDTGGAMPTAVGVMALGTAYYVHALVKVTGEVDFGCDTSRTAANLLADGTISAAGFVAYRCLGHVYVSPSGGAGIVPWLHSALDLNRWHFAQPIEVYSATVTVTTSLVDSAPMAPEESIAHLIGWRLSTSSTQSIVAHGPPGAAPDPGFGPNLRTDAGTPNNGAMVAIPVELDGSRQFYHRTNSATGTFVISIEGFTFARGALPGRRP